uniref:SAND domain-containing protein n=1 Tax=Steinernema glaseri TaxID=37863 RepID=A0A1I7ZJI3_9BILA
MFSCSEAEAHPFEIVWTALADGESIPKLLITTPNGLILEWRRIMTRRKAGVAIEFYRCISCELNNLHKGEKLPHLCVDASKPTSRTLVTDPEMIRHICCEATYIPMNFQRTEAGDMLNSTTPQQEEINFNLLNNFKHEDLTVSMALREPSEPPTKKTKCEDRNSNEQPSDLWSDFGNMIASMARRTASKNVDKAFRMQQGIFRLLHEYGENNHTA